MDKVVDRFRKNIASLEKEIAKKAEPRQTNTPKRAYQAAAVAFDVANLKRLKLALTKLADAREAGTLPKEWKELDYKGLVCSLVTTIADHSGGHYSLRDSGEYRVTTSLGVNFRNWLEGKKSESEMKAEADAAKAQKLVDMEAQIQFSAIPGFFPTPQRLGLRMLELADLGADHLVLEPSAGKGDIADLIRLVKVRVHCMEINQLLQMILREKGHAVIHDDFMRHDPTAVYDRVIMNPPFELQRDIDHVTHAYKFLKPGGRLIAVMSVGPHQRTDNKSVLFREWLHEVDAQIWTLPAGSFKEGFVSTGVNACIVKIDKE